jgi:hypothetical protein
MSFNGASNEDERAFEFFTSIFQDTRLSLYRSGISENLYFNIYYKYSDRLGCLGKNVIKQNQWAIYTIRYNNPYKSMELLKDGILLCRYTTNGQFNYDLVLQGYIGRSSINSGNQRWGYASMSIVGMFVYDRYVTNNELSNIANYLKSLSKS